MAGLMARLYLVLDYCPGGELFFHLSRAGRFSEGRTRSGSGRVIVVIQGRVRLFSYCYWVSVGY